MEQGQRIEAKPLPNDSRPSSSEMEIMAMLQSSAGPLPPSSEFAEYERVCPGAAGRILTQMESQMEHIRSVELIQLEHERASQQAFADHPREVDLKREAATTRQQYIMLVALFLFIGGGLTCAYWHETTIGSLLIGSSLIGVTGHIVRMFSTKSPARKGQE
jgi:uncharacterized membrane protein